MRGAALAPGLALGLLLVAGPAAAETRWLACRYTDPAGAKQTIDLMFDDQRNIAAIFEHGAMVDGANTAITFQSLRSRFPNFILTYNRNDGALSVSPQGAAFGGLLQGECRRSPPPKGAPSTYLGR